MVTGNFPTNQRQTTKTCHQRNSTVHASVIRPVVICIQQYNSTVSVGKINIDNIGKNTIIRPNKGV